MADEFEGVELSEDLQRAVRLRVRRAVLRQRWELLKWIVLLVSGWFLNDLYQWVATR